MFVDKLAESYNLIWENHNFELSVTEVELMMLSIGTGDASENISIQLWAKTSNLTGELHLFRNRALKR